MELDQTQIIAIVSAVFFIFSEIVGASKLKENSVVQLILTLGKKLLPSKK